MAGDTPGRNKKWNPTVDVFTCIGCGTCVTGCSRLVYRYDYENRKPVVVDPLNCMVGCTTCANTRPTLAFPISFNCICNGSISYGASFDLG